jgi:hypothetical protein
MQGNGGGHGLGVQGSSGGLGARSIPIARSEAGIPAKEV